ncbi:MAG: type II toxin-antitoxin system HicB family antitoxin [Elusimicrobia bacterium]|nr:type II toxin-antitoxin system HicB family antitoxin [Elusimicrobiota bacterium]
MLRKITFRVEIFKEGRQFVAICPELNVSSFGATKEKAEKSIHEAVSLFLEECRRMGTLEAVLEEAGFLKGAPHGGWTPPDPVVLEKMDVGIAA